MYIRKAIVEVYDTKTSVTPMMTIEGLRITGEIKYAYDSADVVARIEIYNLSLENRKTLAIRDKNEREEGSASHYIKVYAGHQDVDFVGGGKPLLLQGPLINSFSFNKRPDTHTILYIVPSGQSMSFNKIEQFEATPTMTLEQAIKEIGKRGGYEVSDVSRLPKHIRETSVRGSVFGLEKSLQKEMKKLGDTHHFMTRYSANKMIVKMKSNLPLKAAEDAKEVDMPRPVPVSSSTVSEAPPLVITKGVTATKALDTYKITVDMVRETPRVGQAKIDLSVTLAPEMEHVEVIDVSEIENLLTYDNIGDPLYRDDAVRKYLTSDLYRVSSILHIFDTHGQAWNTFIEAHIFFEGLTAGE